jgi:uncharacterized membrane protein YfcA
MELAQQLLILALTGLLVGTASGVLGVGGCFIMVPIAYWLLASGGLDPTLAMRMALGTSLAVVIPTAAFGAFGNRSRERYETMAGVHLGLSGLLGSSIGGIVASQLPIHYLRLIFGAAVLIGALRLASFRPSGRVAAAPPQSTDFLLWGFPVGFVSGIAGIGGGVLLVPILVIIHGFDIYKATATSSVAIMLTAIGGTAAYIVAGWGVGGLPDPSLGYINVIQFAVLAATSSPAASFAAVFAGRLNREMLRYLFIGLMIYIGFKMIAY